MRRTSLTRCAPLFAALIGLLLPFGDAAAGGPGKSKATASKSKGKGAKISKASKASKPSKNVAKAAQAKNAPLRVVKMKVGSAKKVDDLQPLGGGPSPWSDMPKVAVPKAVGVTANTFPLSPYQPYTQHGYTSVSGRQRNASEKYGFYLPSSNGRLGVSVLPGFWRGHDVTLDCWGDFSGSLKVSARGVATNGAYSEFSSIVMSPPSGNQGRIKVAIPAKSFALKSSAELRVLVSDADRKGRATIIYQCVVSRS